MAKRKRKDNDTKDEKKRKELRGLGHFDQYIPWIDIHEIASIGSATRIKGTKTGRLHHLLSTLELDYFYLLDWSEEVLDIREQYPLDIKETIALANQNGIPHPSSNSKRNCVMTTDFLITVRQNIGTKEVARTVKYSKDLTDPRVLEKFEIERFYWRERNIDWGIVTELDLNKILVKNIKWFYTYLDFDSLPPSLTPSICSEITGFMLPFLRNNDVPLRKIAKDSDTKFSLHPGNSLSLTRHLLAIKQWETDLRKIIQPEKPLILTKINDRGEKGI